MENQARNVYLEQVLEQKAQLEDDLKVQRASYSSPLESPQAQAQDRRQRVAARGQGEAFASCVRITGWWRWKNVIVPPNVYVVHTRRGHPEPLDLGLGLSFRYDPVTDAFLVIPAAMQTILIHADCICKERQGLVVQGYVQWIIDDLRTAYRKLDFSDAYEPMRLVNVQLREQAEAAIKDKVATMSIDEVLADKQPIIEELTARLRQVAEGSGAGQGLGLRIVTVQIKEAVVCSPTVWELIQRPFRAERRKEARLAELQNDDLVAQKEAESQQAAARIRIAAEMDVARLEAQASDDAFNHAQAERIRRAAVEADALEKTRAHDLTLVEHQASLDVARLNARLELERLQAACDHQQATDRMRLFADRRRIENDLSSTALQERLVRRLPEIAEKLPRQVSLGNVALGSTVVQDLIEGLRDLLGRKPPA